MNRPPTVLSRALSVNTAQLAAPLRLFPRSLGDQATSAAASYFHGREAEIRHIVDLVGDPCALPRVLSLTGAPGIGKTALIEAVWRRLHTDGMAEVVVVDTSEFDHSPEELDLLVGARAATWPRTQRDTPLVLVIDGYEAVGVAARRRLREEFMAGISGPVLLVVCERQPPLNLLIHWLGWRQIIEEMHLGPLHPDEARSLLRAQGLDDDGAREAFRVTGCNPLLITLAGEIAQREQDPALRPRLFAEEASWLIAARLRRENADAAVMTLLEAASLFPRFDEEMLASKLGSESAVHFRRLTHLSLVGTVPDGYTVLEPFRSLLAQDLHQRRPRWCAQVVGMAAPVIDAVHTYQLGAPGAEGTGEDLVAAAGHVRRSPELLADVKTALEWIREKRSGEPSRLAARLKLGGPDALSHLHAILADIVSTLTGSRAPRVAEAGRLLRDYYILRACSHEAVADRMNVSRATIFRRLNLGIALVAERLPLSEVPAPHPIGAEFKKGSA